MPRRSAESPMPTPGRCSPLRGCAPSSPPKSLASLAQGGARSRRPAIRSASPARVVVAGIGLFAAVLLAGACSEQAACYAGDFRACTCDDGRRGFAACDAAADAYGACASCGLVPGATWTAAGGAGGGGGAGGAGGATTTTKLGFMETCALDEDCESGICHVYTAKGPRCTLHCQTAADCPPPSVGCNNMGFCKAP